MIKKAIFNILNQILVFKVRQGNLTSCRTSLNKETNPIIAY
jgi:hypothetical protein